MIDDERQLRDDLDFWHGIYRNLNSCVSHIEASGRKDEFWTPFNTHLKRLCSHIKRNKTEPLRKRLYGHKVEVLIK